jgi:ribosomal-protein-alanine N-acetyltransferase
MTESDLDKIMAVMDAAFEPAWGEAWNRRQVADSLAFAHTHYRLVSATGAPPAEDEPAAGFSLVRAAPGEEELLLIAVAPGNRGAGLGRRLLAQVLEDARARQAERVFLEMRFNNSAVSLYQKAGFTPVGRRRDYYRLPDGRSIDAITFACTV